MNRRQFLQRGATGLAWISLAPTSSSSLPIVPPRRPHRLRLVRQEQPLPPPPGRTRRGRLPLRCRPTHADRSRGNGRRPSTLEEHPAHLSRLPRNAPRKGSRHRPGRHPRSLARLPAIAAMEAGADVYVEKPISVDVVEGQAMLATARASTASSRSTPSAAAPPTSSTPATTSSKRACSAKSPPSTSTATGTCEPARIRRTSPHPPTSTTNVDRSRAPCALQQTRAPARLARLHRIRQRHPR
jgi:hypothetical protein